jgi:ABC-type multidrug transport system fused ATPase/permease subunit
MVSQKINIDYSSFKENGIMAFNNLDKSDSQPTRNLTSDYRTFFFILYALIFLISLLGNCLLLVILCRRKRMRTVNNFFLTNIAISNLIYTLFAPFPFIVELEDVNKAWIFFDFMCPIIPFLNTVAINLNTITMIVSSVDRLIEIICPLRSKLGEKKCSLIILVIWIISIVFSWPWNILIKVQEQISISFETEQENIDYETSSNLVESIKLCAPLINYHQIITFYILSLCVVQYFLPLVILCATFALISYYLKVVNAKRIQNDANKLNSNLRKKNEKKVKKI